MSKKIRFILILIIFSACVPNTSTKIIAHRGFSEIAPENTISAFKKAIEIKADYFELDVRKTKDDVLIVLHDKNVKRTTSNNKKGDITALNYSELDSIYVGYTSKFGETYKNEKIPKLKEALLLAKNHIKVFVEIKEKNIEKQVVRLIEELKMEQDVVVLSYNYQTVKKTKEINKKIKTLLLTGKATTKTIEQAQVIKANAIGFGRSTKLDENFIKYAQKNKVKLYMYTINDREMMQKLITLKIDGIITNKPDVALKLN